MGLTILLPLSYMGLLFFVSSLPATDTSQNALTNIPSTLQNLLHVPAFGVLAILWLFSLKDLSLSRRTTQWLAIALSATYGALLEFYQAGIPGRFASEEDFLLNCIGILLFVFLYQKVSPSLFRTPPLKKDTLML